MFPKENTCFTGLDGTIATRIKFLVVNKTVQHLLVNTGVHDDLGGRAEVKYTPLRTNKVVTITFRIEGQEIDELWDKWCTLAAAGVAEATGVDPEQLGQPYEYQRKERTGLSRTQDGKEYDENSAAAWMMMRLHEALAVAEGTMPQHQWSHRKRWRAGIIDLAHPGVSIKQVFDILENPEWAGPDVIKNVLLCRRGVSCKKEQAS